MPEDSTEQLRRQRERHRVQKKVNHERFYFVRGGTVDGRSTDWLVWPPDQQSRDQAFLNALLRPQDMRHVVDLQAEYFAAVIEGEMPNESVDVYMEAVRKTEASEWHEGELENLRLRLDEYMGHLENLQHDMRDVLMVWANEVGRPLLDWKEHHPHTPGEPLPLPDDPWPVYFDDVSGLWSDLFFGYESMMPPIIAQKVKDTIQRYPHPALDASEQGLFAECQQAGVLYYHERWRKVQTNAHVVRAWVMGFEDTQRARYEGVRSERWKSAKEALAADDKEPAAGPAGEETLEEMPGKVEAPDTADRPDLKAAWRNKLESVRSVLANPEHRQYLLSKDKSKSDLYRMADKHFAKKKSVNPAEAYAKDFQRNLSGGEPKDLERWCDYLDIDPSDSDEAPLNA